MTPHDGTSDRPDVGAEIVEAFGRVYRQIRREVEGLDERELRWRPAPNTTPIANIVLHVIAATRVHLSALCGGPYERDREAEFAASPLDADDLVQLLEEAEREIAQYRGLVSDSDLIAARHRPPAGQRASGLAVLLQGYGHAEEHLAQISLTKQWYRLTRGGSLADGPS